MLASCGGNGNRKPLSIVPTPGAVGAATLQWVAPTENEDGSVITDLAGFNIYYGIAAGLYTESIQIDNPSVSVFVVEQLDPGTTYFFAVTAVNAAQVESQFSNEVSKIIE